MDLLGRIGGGDEQGPQRVGLEAVEEVELSLELSLGGRFGPDRTWLPRSSSFACFRAPEEVALGPPAALARTSSLPTMADADARNKVILGDLNAACTDGVEVEPSAALQGSALAVEPVAQLPASGSSSPGSSDGALHWSAVAVAPVATLPASGSPSTGSSDGALQGSAVAVGPVAKLPASGSPPEVEPSATLQGSAVVVAPAAKMPASGSPAEVEPSAILQGSAVAVGSVAKLTASGSPVEVEPSATLQGSPVAVGPVAKLPASGIPAEVEPSATLQGSAVAVGPVAKLPASGSPSTGSSDGKGKVHEAGNTADVLARTSSLPAGIEDEWRKRKEAQSLKRLEVKRKRIERRNSANISGEALGQILEEMNATASAERVENSDDPSMKKKQTGGNVNHSNVRRHSSGLPPTYQAPVASQGSCLPGKLKRHNSAMKGTPSAEERSLPPAVPPSSEGTKGMLPAESASNSVMATPSSSALAVRAAALGSTGEQQPVSERLPARARSMGDVQRMVMQEMPCVCTKGLPNGRKIEGFLYKYRRAEELRIVCVCHGSFLTPAEFVKHAGGGEVANPLRHIVVNPVAHSLN